jgi:integrase
MSKLTVLAVQNAKPKRRHGQPVTTELPDGANGLYLIIQPSGHRSFAVRYRIAKRSRKWVIGDAVASDRGEANPHGVLTLSVARRKAAEAMQLVEAGIDPAGEAKTQRQQQRQRADAAAQTFESVARAYYERMEVEKPTMRSGDRQLADLRRWTFESIGARPISAIKRGDIIRLCDEISKERGVTAADAALALISKVMSDHAVRDENFVNPIVKGMRKIKKPKERARDRVLDDDELRQLWAATSAGDVFSRFLRFLVLTGCRRDEAASMVFSEIGNGDGPTWTLPAARNKTKQQLIRPLSQAAQAALGPRGEADELVFQGNGRRVVSNLDPMKKEFDERATIENFRLHDLRRTSRTLMARAGVPDTVAERMLGHVVGGVKGVYDRHKYVAEMKHAFEALAALIQNIVSPQQDAKVIQLHGE